MSRLPKHADTIFDIVLTLPVALSAYIMRFVRHFGVDRLKLCKKVLLAVGVFPIQNHYYEPQFDFNDDKDRFSRSRRLPGVSLNVEAQLALMNEFIFTNELRGLPSERTQRREFYLNNGSFQSGDAEYWYQLIRTKKPRRIIEIGSGNSTLMAMKAISRNRIDDAGYNCDHTCIEPYEMPWLESTGVKILRQRVEDVDLAVFSELMANDVLFIDSSHVIRPHGDVLFEYLELLPILNVGVIVHIHDIFSPRDYPVAWLKDKVRLWNEQYVLEAFLTHNQSWKVIGALNFIHHSEFDKLKGVAPSLTHESEPGSFYVQRVA